ncbi:hypothetical protein HPB49_021199 [Dermacentor silvarum]|uniref:Uncharacterized protein n=1 Tax=Dermacentor silvarum TaxID=543639 RepID=A0ACB8C5J1_DERSI|nr:hypothetical protein HPB49_021199 [Dermacentor silvarum]
MSSHKGSRLGPGVSAGQREILVEFMERHPYLVKPSCALNPELTAARKQELWKQLVLLLNNEGPAVKTVYQWRAFWNKETHDARHDAAVHAAEHRGTGDGKLPGLRGRIISLVGVASAIGVCPNFFEDAEEVLQDLATGVRALTDAIAQQAADIAQVGDTLLRQTLALERLATAAERQVQQNHMMPQELRTLTRMAPALIIWLRIPCLETEVVKRSTRRHNGGCFAG